MYYVLESPYVDSKKIGDISYKDKAKIIKGPSCSNGWIWWKISRESDGLTGWIPEGNENYYLLLPMVGDQVVNYARISSEVYRVNLRKSPGHINKNNKTDVVIEIPTGSVVKILDGPKTADGLRWWYVEWRGYKGWIAEKTTQGKKILIFE